MGPRLSTHRVKCIYQSFPGIIPENRHGQHAQLRMNLPALQQLDFAYLIFPRATGPALRLGRGVPMLASLASAEGANTAAATAIKACMHVERL